MKLYDLISQYKACGLSEREIILIASHLTGKSKEYLIAHPETECPNEVLGLLDLRLEGYPLQYILGSVEFYGRTFKVEEGVLIPRWETEGLVEIAIDIIRRKQIKLVADIGVGSGVIAVTLALETGVTVLGTDVERKPLEVTLKNAKTYGVEDKIELRLGEFLEPFKERYAEFQLIVSNPPYVKCGTPLQKELLYEPECALFGGVDGLDFYREFFRRYDVTGKIVLMEIGEDQGEELKRMTGGTVLKDLAGKDRYLLVERLS